MIKDIRGLADYFCSDTIAGLNRRLYKDTKCGASISLMVKMGGVRDWLHNGDDWTALDNPGCPIEVVGFTIQTIVEGSDATVDSNPAFFFPVEEVEVESWMTYMEKEASVIWYDLSSGSCRETQKEGEE